MKKNLLRGLFAACLLVGCTLSASATVLFTEDFNYGVDTVLNKGTEPSLTDWSSFSGSSNYILVKDTNLLYPGYAELETTKAVEMFWGSRADDLHKFADVTSGDVYLAALVYIDTLKNTTADYFLTLGDASASNMYARVYFKANSTKDSVQFAITKAAESSSYLTYSTEKYPVKSTMLLVAKYSFTAGGDKNDTTALFVNPVASIYEPVPTVVCNQEATSGSGAAQGANSKVDASKICSVNLRQGSNTPQLILDAIRVTTTWAELFGAEDPGTGDDGNETPTPTLSFECTVEECYYAINATVGLPSMTTVIVKGENLTSDVTITTSTPDLVAFPATVSKEEAMAEGGKLVTLTLTPSMQTGYATATVEFASGGATAPYPLEIYYSAYEPYNSLYAYKLDWGEGSYGMSSTIAGDFVITHIYTQNEVEYMYVQDATAAAVLKGYTGTYTVGDRFSILTVSSESSFGTCYLTPAQPLGEPITNEAATPAVITLADLVTYKDSLAGMLIKVEDVTFTAAGSFAAGSQYDITQSGASAKISFFEDSDIIGNAIPAEKADIVGISRNTTGKLISPRSMADITAKGTATDLDNVTASKVWAADGALHIQSAEAMQVEVLNVAGQTILAETFTAGMHSIALDGGMYLVKVNGAVQKVIVR